MRLPTDARPLAGWIGRGLGARYTRYADDLASPGDAALHPRAGRIARLVGEIAGDEGLLLNEAKTPLMSRAGSRPCGIVVHECDLLKAVLHDAALNGRAAANRAGHPQFRAHPLGRIAWVAQVNPHRGRRLRERFTATSWAAE